MRMCGTENDRKCAIYWPSAFQQHFPKTKFITIFKWISSYICTIPKCWWWTWIQKRKEAFISPFSIWLSMVLVDERWHKIFSHWLRLYSVKHRKRVQVIVTCNNDLPWCVTQKGNVSLPGYWLASLTMAQAACSLWTFVRSGGPPGCS